MKFIRNLPYKRVVAFFKFLFFSKYLREKKSLRNSEKIWRKEIDSNFNEEQNGQYFIGWPKVLQTIYTFLSLNLKIKSIKQIKEFVNNFSSNIISKFEFIKFI